MKKVASIDKTKRPGLLLMAFKLVTRWVIWKNRGQREFEKLERKKRHPLNGTDRLLHGLKIY